MTSILKKVLNLVDNRLPQKKAFPKTLRSVSIVITENCNSRCNSCDFWKKNTSLDEHLSVSKWNEILKSISELEIKRVRFTGGEPFLYKGLFQIIKVAYSLGIHSIGVQTNGLLLAQFKNEINDSEISKLHVSLDGIDNVNDNLRGVKGGYKRVLENLEGINIDIAITTTPFKENMECLEELIVLCKNRNFSLEFNLPSTDLYYLSDAIVNFPSPQQTDAFIALLEKHKSFLNISNANLQFMRTYLIDRKISYKSCILGLYKIFIGFNGDIFSGCYPLKALGNLKKESLKAILFSEPYSQRLDDMLQLKCPGCVCGYHTNPKLKSNKK